MPIVALFVGLVLLIVIERGKKHDPGHSHARKVPWWRSPKRRTR